MPTELSGSEHTLMISIVLPCYNEGKTAVKMIEETSRVLRKSHGESFEIIIVNDGSTDQTSKFLSLAAIREKRLKIISYKKNRGKGYALKKGIKAARGKTIGFIDSDLEIPPYLIPDYIDRLERESLDCVVASKLHSQSIVQQSPKRRLLSLLSRKMIQYLFQLQNIDTQVGLKVFRRASVHQIIDDIKADSFAFDIEMLVLMRREHFRIAAAPVYIHQHDESSKVGTSSILKTFRDVMQIHHRLKRDVRPHSRSYAFMRYAMLACLLLPLEFTLKTVVR